LMMQQFELGIHDELASKLDIGSILLDENARVLKLNSIAHRIVQAHDGLCLRDDRLSCTDTASARALQSAIQSLVAGLKAGTGAQDIPLKIKRDQRHDWSLLCRPVFSQLTLESKSSPAIQVLVRSTGQMTEISTRSLTRIFPFTNAQALLAIR